MKLARPPARRVLCWDLDKTYLVSNFDSLRSVLKLPFEKGRDKVAVPGVVELIRALRRSAEQKGERPQLRFLSASPPQLAPAVLEKLELDGIEHDGIDFKDQMHHLVRARFEVLREQIGYKLAALLERALEAEPDRSELLFGDDWESDPFIYSLYADLLEGRVSANAAGELLEVAGVHRHYRERVAACLGRLEAGRPGHTVEGIFIRREGRGGEDALRGFGPRLVWFDDYFECCVRLYAAGLIGLDGAIDVGSALSATGAELAASFEAACRRNGLAVERLSRLRRALVGAGLVADLEPGSRLGRTSALVRRMLAPRSPPHRLEPAAELPDYRRLAELWSRRGRKEVRSESVIG